MLRRTQDRRTSRYCSALSAPLHPQYTIHNAPQNQLLLLCLHSAPTIHNAQYSIPLYNTAVASYILYCHIVLITSIINRNQLPRSVLSLLHPSRFLPHLSKLSSSNSLQLDMIRLILQVVCGLLLLGAAKSTSTNYDCSRPTFDTGRLAWLSCIVTPSLLPRSLFHPTVNHSAITVNRFDSDGTSDYFEYWQVSNYWLVFAVILCTYFLC